MPRGDASLPVSGFSVAALVVDEEADCLEGPEGNGQQIADGEAYKSFLDDQQQEFQGAKVDHGQRRDQLGRHQCADADGNGVAQHAGHDLAVENWNGDEHGKNAWLRTNHGDQECLGLFVGQQFAHVVASELIAGTTRKPKP
jgi:hypothetical protein